MTNFMGYRQNLSENTDNKYSTNLWTGCPIDEIRSGFRAGIVFEERFQNGPVLAAGADVTTGYGYRSSMGTANTTAVDDAIGGGIVMTTGASNTQCILGSLGQPFQITSGAGSFWFEARVEFDSIADNEPGWLIGLCDSTAFSATVPITAAGALADLNLVGFHRLEADGDQLDTVYKADGVSAVNVATDAITLVAATAVKVGMHFDTDSNKLTFYKNGVALADTKTIPDATGTDFPADVRLGLVIAGLSGSGGSGTNTVSWVRAVQEIL